MNAALPRVSLTRIPRQPMAADRNIAPVTIGRLMTEPIAQLLAAADDRLYESSIPDREFYGAAIVRGGRPILLMPRGRSDLENDVITRYLLAQALDLNTDPLPKPFDVVVRPLGEVAQ
ncbi:hypothetical protein [Streptomyces sp. NPDC048577]|uniref:hypothetical protein n=1 Tax=Streptomyces sp. NPDC048577 TaxID=3157209 RepID=UPI00343A0C86